MGSIINKNWIKQNIKRMSKYAVVGAIGTLINMSLLYFLTEYVGFWYILSSVFATLVAFIFNYTFNTIWTYRNPKNKENKTVNK